MIIKSVRVQNFRCLKDVTLNCDPLTVLVGQNGAGKSTLLQALKLFYEPSANYDVTDFYANNSTEDISVTVEFTKLTDKERKLFSDYALGETLVVEKVLKYPSIKKSQKYFGWRMKNSEFEVFRRASGKSGLTQAYNELKQNQKYKSFSPYTNKEEIEDMLKAWESSHPEQCERSKDEGQFFGFKEVGESRLERYTRFILVPAVQDAAEEACEGKGSMITDILDLVVRNTLANKPELTNLQERIQNEYGDLLDPTKIPELQGLAGKLTSTLKDFVPNSEVYLSWEPKVNIDLPFPPASIQLLEDGYFSTVNHAGNGLQRAFILTLLQHLTLAQATQPTEAEGEKEKEELPMPNLIIGIEEPELFQHPDRQRHFAKTLLKLSEKKLAGVSESTQVIYCTHSPLLVDTERFDQTRIFGKVDVQSGVPKQTLITFSTLDNVAKLLEKACGKPEGTFTGETLRQRLHAVMTPRMNEGFFSRLVVLVEGINDRALILGTALALGYDLESSGISVIECNGKHNMDRPLAIFKSLGVKTYAIWDCDIGDEGAKQFNQEMCRLLGYSPEDYPEVICRGFACVKTNLEKTFKDEIGVGLFNQKLQQYCDRHELGKGEYAIENPTIVSDLVKEFHAHSAKSETVERIVKEIVS